MQHNKSIKAFDRIFFKNGPLNTYLVIFHLKMIICQNVNLPHICDHRTKKHPFVK